MLKNSYVIVNLKLYAQTNTSKQVFENKSLNEQITNEPQIFITCVHQNKQLALF
jgi:hypothetical protein